MDIINFDKQNPEHRMKIDRWGKKHNFPLPPDPFLPDLGLIVNDTACGFLYTTDGGLGWIEWVFSNPDKTTEERKEALDILMKALENAAQARGLRAVCSSAKNDAYRKILERNGFKETDNNMTHHIKGIEKEE